MTIPGSLNVREAAPPDIDRLVELHMTTLSGGLAALGARAIRRYYSRAMTDSGSLLLVATGEHASVAGLIELELHQRGMLERHGGIDRLVFAGFASRRLVTAARMFVRGRDGFARPSPDAAFLRFFAVEPLARGHGIGGILLRAASHQAEAAGLRAIETATTNRRLIDHYRRQLAATVLRSWGHEPARSFLIRIPLPLPEEAPLGQRG